MKYSEFLYAFAKELDKIISPEPYLCCHLNGVYLDKEIYSSKSEKYVELITSSVHKKHRTRLKITITQKMKNYNKLRGDSITTLTVPLREQNLNRVQWLQCLSKLAEIKESKGK